MAKFLITSLFLSNLARAWGPGGFGDYDCTSTITTTADPGTAPVYRFSKTLTYVSYATILTTYAPVDCDHCTALATETKTLDVNDVPGTTYSDGFETRWIVALEPTYVTEPYCKPTRGTGMTIPDFVAAQMDDEPELKIRDQGLSQKKAQGGIERAAPCLSIILLMPEFTAGPTRTVWTTTTTQTSTVDCGICEDVIPQVIGLGIPPVVLFNATTTAHTPSVTTVYECGPTPAPSTTLKTTTHPSKKHHGAPLPTTTTTIVVSEEVKPTPYPEPDIPEDMSPTTVTPLGIDKPKCTSSTELPAVIADSTWTIFPSTVTSTTTVDCGECALAWSTGVVYYFAPIIYTSTITAVTPSVKENLACSAVPTEG